MEMVSYYFFLKIIQKYILNYTYPKIKKKKIVSKIKIMEILVEVNSYHYMFDSMHLLHDFYFVMPLFPLMKSSNFF